MSSTVLSPPHLDREFLPTRAKILEIAAALDRIERATFFDTGERTEDNQADRKNLAGDPRWKQLQAGIQLLLTGQAQRAEQVQLLFSRPYDEQWRQTLEMTD